MAGYYRSARREVLAHLKQAGVLINTQHARAILRESNDNIPRIEQSLGFATDALLASGVVNVENKGAVAYEEAIQAAMSNRREAVSSGQWPEIVQPLQSSDLMPWAEPKTSRSRSVANVQYPLSYALALERGYTLRGTMHPQAYFLLRAMEKERAPHINSWKRLLAQLSGIHVKIKFDDAYSDLNTYRGAMAQQQMERQRAAELRLIDKQMGVNFNNPLGLPNYRWEEFLEGSGESHRGGRADVRKQRVVVIRYRKNSGVSYQATRYETTEEYIGRLQDAFDHWSDPAGFGR